MTENYGVYTYGVYTQMDNTVTNVLMLSCAEHKANCIIVAYNKCPAQFFCSLFCHIMSLHHPLAAVNL